MPRGPSRPWRRLAPHTEQAFPYVRAALAQGYDVELTLVRVDPAEVDDFRRGLFNAAKHTGVSLHCHKRRAGDGTWTLVFAVHKKSDGRAHILGKHGSDRTQWPYNPRRPSPRDDEGNRTDIDDHTAHARA